MTQRVGSARGFGRIVKERMMYLDITGVNLIDLVKAVYELSRPQGLGFLHFEEGGLTDEEAEQLVSRSDRNGHMRLGLDYVKGRACKFHAFSAGDRLLMNARWYDHTADDTTALLKRLGLERREVNEKAYDEL
jgi:hypothetical protein